MRKASGFDGVAIAPHFVVQMRAGRAAAAADLADDGAGRDVLADLHVDPAQMCVARRKSVAMIDLDHAAVAAVPARLRNDAWRRGMGAGAERRAKVDARMQRRGAEQRILADAVAARDRPTRRRIVDRKRARFLLQRVQLVERVVQFLDLGVEHGRAVDGDQRSADPLLAIVAVDRKPGILQRAGDLVGGVVGVGGKRRDAGELFRFDRAQRLVDGHEQLVGVVGG